MPLGSLVTLRHITGPYRVLRYNLFPAAEIQGDTAPGHSSGEALDTMEKLARADLPPGYGFDWTELSFQERLAGNTGLLGVPERRWCSSSCCWRRCMRA